MKRTALCLWLLATAVFADSVAPVTNTFCVAAYNVENWVLMERNKKPDQPKPAAAKQAVFEMLAKVRADVLGLEEVGTTNELAEIATGLAARGLDYPYREWIQGADENRHVALLSRFPITDRLSRTDYTYTLGTNVMRIQRGILDVGIKVNDRYSFRAIVVHLKSRRQVEEFDQAAARLGEARLLRSHIGKILKADHDRNLIVMGDFNDTPESEPIKAILGEAPFALTMLNPADNKGYFTTHFWRAKREWSRIDYLITSPGMAKEFVPDSARIGDFPMWETASDHRPIFARFFGEDR